MNDDLVATMPFSRLMGIELVEATADLVRGSLKVRPELCTVGGVMHGAPRHGHAPSYQRDPCGQAPCWHQ